MLDLKTLVEYEICNHWLAHWTLPARIQTWLANRIIDRTKKRLYAYKQFLVLRKLKENGAKEGHIKWVLRQSCNGKYHFERKGATQSL